MRSDRASGRLAERVVRHESEILAGLMPRESGLGPATVLIRPLEERSVHEIATLEVVCPPASAQYFAKATVPGYTGKQDLVAESHVLSEIAPRIAALNPHTRCPRLIAFFPEEKLLIEEFVPGQSLKSLLFDFPRTPADLERLLALSGEWLAHFHNQTRSGYANPFDWLMEELGSDALVSAFHRCAIPQLHSRAVHLLHNFARQYSNLSRPLCQVHGEFSPLHILVQNDSLYVIDFGSSHPGFAYEDLARFSTFYEGLLPWRWAVALLRFPVSRQTDSFLKSYTDHAGSPMGPEDDVLNRFARLCAMAHQQSNWERGPRSHREKLPLKIRRAWTRRRFALLARRELLHLQRLAQADCGNLGYASSLPMTLGADTQLGD